VLEIAAEFRYFSVTLTYQNYMHKAVKNRLAKVIPLWAWKGP